MTSWKMPPKEKIYEALSAIADGRVDIKKNINEAQVTSSSGDKAYLVKWSGDMKWISSNDNASYWQGYLGYPIIAVLIGLGKFNYNEDIAKQLSGIPWKKINDQFKRDYVKAVDSVLNEIESKGGNRDAIAEEVDKIYSQLLIFKIERGPKNMKPPKSN